MPATLVITPQCARLTRDVEGIGQSMDPYCKITIGARQERTKVHPDGGKFPQWSDSFTFSIVNEDIIKFEVWDRNHVSSDSIVGEGAFAMATVVAAGNLTEWY